MRRIGGSLQRRQSCRKIPLLTRSLISSGFDFSRDIINSGLPQLVIDSTRSRRCVARSRGRANVPPRGSKGNAILRFLLLSDDGRKTAAERRTRDFPRDARAMASTDLNANSSSLEIRNQGSPSRDSCFEILSSLFFAIFCNFQR